MRRSSALLLLLVMGIAIFPWQLVCLSHPLGHSHEHHNPGKPSACELHRLAARQPGQHFLPPMTCEHLQEQVADFQQTQVEKIVPTVQMAVVAAVIFDLLSFETTEQPFLLPPDSKCRSATLLSDGPLRAPPLV